MGAGAEVDAEVGAGAEVDTEVGAGAEVDAEVGAGVVGTGVVVGGKGHFVSVNCKISSQPRVVLSVFWTLNLGVFVLVSSKVAVNISLKVGF